VATAAVTQVVATAEATVEATVDTPTVTATPQPQPENTVAPEELLPGIEWSGEATPPPEPTRAVSPELLLPSLTFALGGGGAPGTCYGSVAQPVMMSTVPASANNTPLGEIVVIWGCGFTPFEIASLVFRRPDGAEASDMVEVDEGGEWAVMWRVLPGTPLGAHTVTLSSSTGIYSLAFEVFAPAEPTLRTDCINEDEVMAILTGFVPGEEVLLGRYDIALDILKYVLTGYEYARIGPDGTAVINLPPSHYLVAIGQDIRPVKIGDYPTETEFIASALIYEICFVDRIKRY
jgi:hypothetical protein